MSELRLINYEERQDKDTMSLEDEKWPLWSKKEDKQTWIMSYEANTSSCMEVWNSKSSGNMYSKFETKFRSIIEVHFMHAIYHFEAREIKSPIL